MSKEKHGVFGTIIKVIMAIVFTAIGALILTAGAYSFAKNPNPNANWIAIVNIIFGCLLLTAIFFLKEKRGGLNVVIKVIMIIAFFVIGAIILSAGAYSYSKNPSPSANWIAIVNITFGSLLLTSPIFFKK